MDGDLDRLSDAHGAMVLGWLRPGVFYMRLSGRLGNLLVGEGTNLFTTHLRTAERAQCFVDAFEPEDLEFGSKSALLHAFMTRKRQLANTLFLVHSRKVEDVARMFATMMGDRFTVTRDVEAFQAQVDAAAPQSDWRRRSGAPTRLSAEG